MPTYEYKCSKCENLVQITRSVNDNDPGYECETCKIPLSRIYSVGAITFNGSGFYSKDK